MGNFRTKICFEGLNMTRTLNVLSQKYMLCNVFRQGKHCEIIVPSKVFKQVVAFLEERCYNITNIQKIGVHYVASFARTHFLLPLFLVAAMALLAMSSNYCWKIDVVGDYSVAEVAQALQNCNVGIGTSLHGFSTDRLENSLATQLDAMYAVVNRKGSTLFVNAVKKKQAETPVDMHSRRDIVSPCSGVVVSLLCEQGNALVQVGQSVQQGQTLVEGLRVFNDGTTQNVYALGKIVVQQQCTGFAEFCGTTTQTEETGKTFVATSVVLFGQSYGKMPPFSSYRTTQNVVQLFPLNLSVVRTTYYETIQVTKKVTIFECLDQLKLLALQQATSQANFMVTSTLYKIAPNGVYATVFGETVIN